MSTKHTPGPWKWQWQDEAEGYSLRGPQGQRVATIRAGVIPTNDDSPLIAAAPELLAALKALLAYADAYANKMREIGRGAEELGEGADSSSVSGMARAAIARAEGR